MRYATCRFPAISQNGKGEYMSRSLAEYYGRLVEVLQEGAFVSLIRYNDLGMEITEYVENSELDSLRTEDEE